MSDEPRVKCVMVGSAKCGKSSLLLRATTDTFIDMYEPTCDETYFHTLQYNGNTISISIVDTCGEDMDLDNLKELFSDTRVFILVFDQGDLESFKQVEMYRQVIHDCHQNVQDDYRQQQCILGRQLPSAVVQKQLPIVVVGTKCDLASRAVSREAGERLANLFGNVPYIECSAVNNVNCEAVLDSVVRVLHESVEFVKVMKPRKKDETCVIM